MTRFMPLFCLIIFLFSLLTGHRAVALVPTATTVTYTASSTNFANPERGFYHHVETRGSDPTSYSLSQLQGYRTSEKITLIYCINVLDSFVTTAISQSFLDHMQSNFDTVRTAGLKCILRFSYTDIVNGGNGNWPPVPPYGDATKAQMLAHIEQLRPVLQANSDVIATVQMGFIGIWGEGYYTDYFVDDPNDPGTVSAARWQDRREVLDALLGVLPPSRMTAVRTPEMKQNMFGTSTTLPQANAYNGSPLARISYHNDCFLASDSDFGTWQSAAGKAYMADESQFVAMGGETCNYNPPRSACPSALVELALFHWSYLNIDYHPDVLTNASLADSWVSGGCLEEIRQNLGYRLVLQAGTYDDAVQPGQQFNVTITLQNVGYASPFNPRPVQLLLRNQTTGEIYVASLPEDLRFWFGGETAVLDHNICLPGTIPTGSYDLLLNLPDRSPSLATRPEYAILFANAGGVQETATGYNKLLHTLSVDNAASAAPCSNGITAAPFTAAPVAPTLAAALGSTQVNLTWNAAAANCSLTLYGDTSPYFMAAPNAVYDDMLTAGVTATTVGLAEVPYFYMVEAVGCDGAETAVSNQVGSFPFAIQPGG